jgi:hypothetical protein
VYSIRICIIITGERSFLRKLIVIRSTRDRNYSIKGLQIAAAGEKYMSWQEIGNLIIMLSDPA